MRGIGTINGVTYETRGKWLIKDPIIGETSGKITITYDDNLRFGSMQIRNMGQYPLRIEGGKTLLPYESHTIGVEDIHTLENDELTFKFVTSGVTAVSNTSSGYTNAYVIEVNGLVVTECVCEKKC